VLERLFLEQGNHFAAFEVLQAWARTGWAGATAAKPIVFPFEQHTNLQGATRLLQAMRLSHLRDHSGAEQLASESLEWFQRQTSPSHWLAEALTFRARLAVGMRPDGRAQTDLREARGVYERLGDWEGARRLSSSGAAGAQGTKTVGPIPDEEMAAIGAGRGAAARTQALRAELNVVETGVIAATLSHPTWETESLRFSAQDRPLIREILDVSSFETVSSSFVKRFASDWARTSNDLGELILSPRLAEKLVRDDSDGQTDLRLEITPHPLACLPWEFMTLWNAPGSLCLAAAFRYTYRAAPLLENLPQPETRRPMALVLQPSLGTQRMTERGAQGSGIEIRNYYEGHGFDVQVLDDPTVRSFVEAVTNLAARVIHVACTMKQSPSLGGAYLDFAGRLSEGELLTPSTFVRISGHVAPGTRPGLLVFDVLNPGSRTETVRQLLLRNLFAWEVYRLGAASAVLATGLGQPWEQDVIYARLASGLREGLPLGAIGREIRARVLAEPSGAAGEPLRPAPLISDRLEDVLPFLGTALFCQDPEARVTPAAQNGPDKT
jgi:hypothetical protein